MLAKLVVAVNNYNHMKFLLAISSAVVAVEVFVERKEQPAGEF